MRQSGREVIGLRGKLPLLAPKPKIGEHKVVRYLVGPPGGQMRTPDGGRLRLGPSKSFLQEALVRDLDPRTHQGGDDVVSDFSIRLRHAATSDDVEDVRWWTRPQERIVRLGSIAIPKHRVFWRKIRLYDCEHMVFNLWNCLPEHRPLGSVNRDAACGLSCLAADTAETEHGGS